MKISKILLVLLLLSPVLLACSDKYDDTELRNSMNDLQARVSALEAAQKALENNVLIESVQTTEEGYIITFTDGTKAVIINDKPINIPPDKDTCYIDHIDVDDNKVTFYLSDGSSFIIKFAYSIEVTFDLANNELLMVAGQERRIPFVVASDLDDVDIEVFTSNDIRARVDEYNLSSKSGTLVVQCLGSVDEYSKVVLLATNGRRVVMKRLAFTNEGIDVYDNSEKDALNEGGTLNLEFVSSVEVDVDIPAEASSWISLVPAGRSAEVQCLQLYLEPNYGADRDAYVTVSEHGGDRKVVFHVKQKGVSGFGEIDERQAVLDLLRGEIDVNAYADIPLGNFPGVSVDAEGHVEQIDVLEIDQPLLPSIGNLHFLKKFKVQVLKVNTLPDEFGLLSSLEHLEFGCTYNTGDGIKSFLPAPIYNLGNLKVLHIFNHPITGIDPKIQQLQNLEVLILNSGKLRSIDFDAICRIEKLREFDISCNYELSGEISPKLFQLPQLEVLNLNFCYGVKGAVPEQLWTNSRLKTLGLGDLKNVSISLPSSIGAMSNLEVLYISGTDLHGSIPQDIGECSKLRNISLDFTNVSGEIPQSITQLKNLEAFCAIMCELSGSIPIGFKNCPNLSVMQLSGNKLTGGITVDLAGIDVLWLYNNQLSGVIPRDFIDNSSFWRNNWGKIYIDNNFEPIELGFDGPDLTDYYDTAFTQPFKYVDEYAKHELTVIFQFTPTCTYYQQAYDLIKDAYDKYNQKGLFVIGRTFAEHAGVVKNANYPWPTYWTQQVDYPTYVTPTISIINRQGKLIYSDLVQERTDLPVFLDNYFK